MNENCLQFINRFSNELKKIYSTSTLNAYQSIINDFLIYCEKENILSFSRRIADKYISKISECDMPSNFNSYVRIVNMLVYFEKFDKIPYRSRLVELNWPGWFYPTYLDFVEDRKYRNITECTITKQHIKFEKFSNYLDMNGISSFSQITLKNIQQYLEYNADLTLSQRYHIVSCLKVFFQFLYDKNYVSTNFKELIPRVNYSHKAHIPSVYAPEEIESLLAVVDRANPIGKRDYTILLLAARLGLRASDICGLCFDDVDWTNNQINIIMQKTNGPLQLPLTAEVGNAIIDYIRNGRPKSKYRNIFLRHIHPIEPMYGSSLHGMIQRYFYDAGIDIKNRKHGPHALRHSLASNMLSNNTPLPTISNVLGHKSTATTQIYLKIDINNLAKCALPLFGGDI